MSEQFNSFTGPIKKEIVDQIEQLNLSTLQKLHLKLLSHCLEIFKEISYSNKINFPEEKDLKGWCELEAKKLNDLSFAVLLLEQMKSAAEKLKDYANQNGKKPLDLNLDDLILLTSSNN